MKLTIICEYLRKNFFNYVHILLAAYIFTNVQTFTLAQPMFSDISTQLKDIRTVQLRTSTDSLTYPAVVLGEDDYLILSFDELNADARTLHYSFRHCNADWLPSDLMDIEFFNGFNKVFDQDKYHLSFNTTTDYIHYHITIPTINITVSGNYIITVFDDDDTELLRRPFIVYEKLTGIQSRLIRQKQGVTAMQTMNIALQHQQINTNNAATEIKIAIWQNNNPWTWTIVETPSFIRPNELVFDDAATFEAGNEHRWADNRSLRYNGMNVGSITFHDPYYHITLNTDVPSTNYYFYTDFNGMHYIEARDIHYPADYAADYNFVHFTLRSPNIGNIFLFGDLTEQIPYPMQYDQTQQTYYANILLKQGLHSYCYIQTNDAQNIGTPNSQNVSVTDTEGCFAETENDYYIVVYYRSMGDTTDRIIGFKKHNSQTTLNDFIR